jgi:hypothetical protein
MGSALRARQAGRECRGSVVQQAPEPAQHTVRRRRQRVPLTVLIVGLLFVLQGILLLAIGFSPELVATLRTDATANLAEILDRLPATGRDGIWLSRAWALLGLLALVTAIGIFLLQPVAWTMGMADEGICLLVTMARYFADRPRHIYPIMVLCIVIVLYLNYSEVTDTLRSYRSTRYRRRP